ncbi:MAG: recombinase RecT [Syntrophales bacterium]
MAKTEDRALTPQAKAQSIRALFNDNRVKGEIMKALPKHMTADKLIRVAMTSIQRNPKLMDCTQQSLLGCIMTSAALGLEPDPFLGQAYFVPYWNTKKNCYEAQFMPGYRGYIALARRTGELQSVSSQVVYERDFFTLQYGLTEKLDHIPADGDRGDIKGAYVIFRYKDGAYSFDYMTYADIKAIAKRSKTYDEKKNEWTGPWATDEGEMCKKTVVKRHAKLTPMSVEFSKASALEDRAHMGESQMDLLTDDAANTMIDMDAEAKETPDLSTAAKDFDDKTSAMALMPKYIEVATKHFKKPSEEIKAEALKDMAGFLAAYEKWAKAQAQKETVKKAADKPEIKEDEEMAPAECPDRTDSVMSKAFCDACKSREGCPVWS